MLERNVILPGSKTNWRYQIAQSREALDAQVGAVRQTLIPSLALLGLGLIILAALQTFYGLWPLRHIRRAIAAMRGGQNRRVDAPLPLEVQPMVDELNALLAHNEKQAEEARLHAGNLAHALKTPLTVLVNSATSSILSLPRPSGARRRRCSDRSTITSRARALSGGAVRRRRAANVLGQRPQRIARWWPRSTRTRGSMPKASKTLIVRVERADLDELVGNLLENAAKYGGGSVFVTVQRDGNMAEILVEDDGAGISPDDRVRVIDRGVRLDSGKPGTGLGLAIVRDVAEIYGGSVTPRGERGSGRGTGAATAAGGLEAGIRFRGGKRTPAHPFRHPGLDPG